MDGYGNGSRSPAGRLASSASSVKVPSGPRNATCRDASELKLVTSQPVVGSPRAPVGRLGIVRRPFAAPPRSSCAPPSLQRAPPRLPASAARLRPSRCPLRAAPRARFQGGLGQAVQVELLLTLDRIERRLRFVLCRPRRQPARQRRYRRPADLVPVQRRRHGALDHLRLFRRELPVGTARTRGASRTVAPCRGSR